MSKCRVRLTFALVVCAIVASFPAPAQQASSAPPPACASPPPPYSGNKVALVVGTNDYSIYQYDKIPNLQNAVNDARTMAELLMKQGFVVRCLFDPTQLQFRNEKTRLAQYLQGQQLDDPQAADGGRAVIYVAGHGYRDPDSNQDYLLFQFEPDVSKYQHVVNFDTVAGRIEEGRWAVQTLAQEFNAMTQGVMFIFDACRSVVGIPSAPGLPAREAGPMRQLQTELMRGFQVVAYSTQPGGLAADLVPNSDEPNGLYASTLSSFIDLPLYALSHALHLTAVVVRANKQDQVPIYSATEALFLDNPWVNDEPRNACALVNSSIWNAAGRTCSQLRDKGCIKKDICPVVLPLLRGATAAQAKACLEQHKAKWLHNDLIGVCSGPQPSPAVASAAPTAGSGGAPLVSNIATPGGPPNAAPAAPPAGPPTIAPAAGASPRPSIASPNITSPSAAPPIIVVPDVAVPRIGPTIIAPARPSIAPPSLASPGSLGPSAAPPGANTSGSNVASPAGTEKAEAYNVVVSAEPNPSSSNLTKLVLAGWANNTASTRVGVERRRDLNDWQTSLDKDLAKINNPALKLAFANKQRDSFIAKSDQGKAPLQFPPAPFTIDLAGQTITPRNLPAGNAAMIDTFTGDNATAEIDCSTIPCVNDWIGVRVKRGNTVNRGWVPAEDLKSVVKPGATVNVEYDGMRIAPNQNSIDAIRQAVRPDKSKPPTVGRVHIVATRSNGDDGSSPFVASARLSYLDRVIVDLGVKPEDVDQTVVELPGGSSLPAVIINVGPPASK